jgi:hypothetical protein
VTITEVQIVGFLFGEIRYVSGVVAATAVLVVVVAALGLLGLWRYP